MSSFNQLPLFPDQTPSYILSFQFSSWYPSFSKWSIKSTIIRPLSKEFHDYLDADGVFVPEGSEDVPAESLLSDDEEEDEEEDNSPIYAFPELDEKIRSCVKEYDGVFPKLNFTSPQDASWVLPASSPLKCTSPADVYLLLKSSDFITHDLHAETVFEGCDDASTHEGQSPVYELELVLRKWYPIDKSREFRCFVRNNILVGISQRDRNYYDYLTDPATQQKIISSIQQFWETYIKAKWEGQKYYTFDFLLTRDLTRGHIMDFNPYSLKTDPLLFSYEDLQTLHSVSNDLPKFEVIDSASHPIAASNAPVYQHNMIPHEAVAMSSGRDIEGFADMWKESLQESMKDSNE